jgi:hypothetical protein
MIDESFDNTNDRDDIQGDQQIDESVDSRQLER